jgi:hypothetical protein
MTLQNYCKWSGIYFCHVVCFEKTLHIAALRFRWWLDCHDSDDVVHKWWWWLQIVLFLDMGVELGDLLLMASRLGVEELLQSVKAWYHLHHNHVQEKFAKSKDSLLDCVFLTSWSVNSAVLYAVAAALEEVVLV